MNKYEVRRGQTPIHFVEAGTGDVMETLHSLPLSSRTPEEVLEDRALEFAFMASQNRSDIRRSPARYESYIVVELLDEFDDRTRRIGSRAAQHIRVVSAIQGESQQQASLDN